MQLKKGIVLHSEMKTPACLKFYTQFSFKFRFHATLAERERAHFIEKMVKTKSMQEGGGFFKLFMCMHVYVYCCCLFWFSILFFYFFFPFNENDVKGRQKHTHS